jgi:hypothetical protein
MNLKCPFCPRTFSKRSAYAQHITVCSRNNVDIESDSDTSIEDNNKNNENNILYDEV